MSESCNHNCEGCSADCSSREKAPGIQKEALNQASSVKKVIGKSKMPCSAIRLYRQE